MKAWFSAIAAAQILFLGAQAGYYHYWQSRGEIVELKVVPVDPRSLFLGNYADLSFDISTPGSSTGPARFFDIPDGARVYLELEPRRGGAILKGLHTRIPRPAAPGRVYLRGRKWGSRVDLGIERYYIPETRSAEVERLQQELIRRERPPRVTVEVAVSPTGQGLIRRVLVDGKPAGF